MKEIGALLIGKIRVQLHLDDAGEIWLVTRGEVGRASQAITVVGDACDDQGNLTGSACIDVEVCR